MVKSEKPKNAEIKYKKIYSLHPWECRHHQYHSEITAYVEASGEWEVVSIIRSSSGASAETMATFICDIINDAQKNQGVLQEAMEALQTCLEEDGLTFSSEQTVDRIMARIKKHYG